MDTVEKQFLATRTRQRNTLTRFAFLCGGVMAPLEGLEAALDAMALPSIENYIAISDEAWGIKETQRDRTIEVSQQEIDQDVYLAEAKAATGRAKIAIERAADEYTLAARVYDALVKGLIMGAKEYAALVELEQLANEEARAGLAIDKEALHLIEVQIKTQMQAIEQAQVEADLAKAQVDVAKAHVRAAMAGIEAGEAEVKLIEAQTQVFIAEAEKATLQADVASIYAEILVKKLTETKFLVGKDEILAGYRHIQSKLDDALISYETKRLIEEIRTEAEAVLKDELDLFLEVEKAEQDLKTLESDYARLTLTFEETQTALNIQQDAAARAVLVAAKNRLSDARLALTVGRDGAQTVAQKLLNEAHKATYDLSCRYTTSIMRQTEYISG